MQDDDRVGTEATESITSIFLSFSTKRLEAASTNITRCIERLDDTQLWSRSADWENSVGNLVLHLEGNIRQFILHAVAGQTHMRDRDKEFSLSYQCSREDLMMLFDGTMRDVYRAVSSLAETDLRTITDPHTTGWRLMTKLECIYNAVGHFQLHTGQIIFLTKQLTTSDLDLSIPRLRT